MDTKTNTWPRRMQLGKMSKAERAIYDALIEVEKVGADVKLTEAIKKLHEARELVADFVDENLAILNK